MVNMSSHPNQKSTMYLHNIDAPVIKVIEMIDWCFVNIHNPWFRNNGPLNYDSWQLIKAHWLDKLSLSINTSIILVFSKKEDSLLFVLTYGDWIHND